MPPVAIWRASWWIAPAVYKLLSARERGPSTMQEFFDPDSCPDAGSSLAISMGRGGARLSHGHQKQYTYVLQSLTLCEPLHLAS